MKKLCNLLVLGSAAMVAGAQQLPNAGFEGNWIENRPWNTVSGTELTMRQAAGTTDPSVLENPEYGIQPEGWVVSNVAGVVSQLEEEYGGGWGALGATLVGTRVEGFNSSYAICLTNNSNPFMTTQIVPGYLTLGTTWATNTLDLTTFQPGNKDGGVFGGMEFSARPDAFRFMYLINLAEDGTADDKFTALAYSWKGTWSQADVPGNNSMSAEVVTTTMIDRDRNILGMETSQGGEVTASEDALLIAKGLQYIPHGEAGWNTFVLPLEYFSADAPEKINVVISSNDYFDTENIRNGNSISIDDAEFVYFSRLASVTVNGVEIAGFNPDVYEYKVSGDVPAAENVAATLLGEGKTAIAEVKVEGDTVLITVTNANGSDVDGESTHVYTITFGESDATSYSGYLNIEMLGSVIAENQPATIEIIDNGDMTCTFRLPDFSIDLGDGMTPLGDIVIENVKMTDEGNGTMSYAGTVEGLELADGAIVADVTLNGTIANGEVNMQIDVLWSGIPVNVTFTGSQTGITGIGANNSEPAVYYNLNGVRMNPGNLPAGIYIRRQGNVSERIIVR